MELVSTCAIPHQMCGGQNNTETGFSSVVFFSPLLITVILPVHSPYFAFTTNAI